MSTADLESLTSWPPPSELDLRGADLSGQDQCELEIRNSKLEGVDSQLGSGGAKMDWRASSAALTTRSTTPDVPASKAPTRVSSKSAGSDAR